MSERSPRTDLPILHATLTCPCCGSETKQLWCFAWCMACWYTVCGGDQASDWSLSVPPSVVLS